MTDPAKHGNPPDPGIGTTAGTSEWDPVVARAVHTAQVFGQSQTQTAPGGRVGPPGVPTPRWELALGAQGAAQLLSGLWVEATAHGLPVPAEVAAAIRALSAWSKELAGPRA
ncbi:MAG TPA: hypothetical protein VG276_05020 [Actinomycetes bacterium]|jgi:hypothetical protein|nr:hypothetical protein [Actinomycetes bacterium]